MHGIFVQVKSLSLRSAIILGFMFGALLVVLMGGVVLAGPSINEYDTTLVHSSPDDILAANGDLWYMQKSSTGFGDIISKVDTSGNSTDYSLIPTGYTTVKAQSPVVSHDGLSIWFIACTTNTAGNPAWSYGKFDTVTGSTTLYTFSSYCSTSTISPRVLGAGPDGNMWLFVRGTNGQSSRLYSISATGSLTSKKTWSGTDIPASHLITGPDNNLWLSSGTGVRQLMYSSATGTITGEVLHVTSVAPYHFLATGASPDGNVWYAKSGGVIGKIAPTGGIVEYAIPGASSINDLAVGADGALWFVEFSSSGTNKIGRITINGTATMYPLSIPGVQVTSIAAGSDGGLWFTERTAKKIGRIGY